LTSTHAHCVQASSVMRSARQARSMPTHMLI
jgi:hypothetical protein